MLHIKNEEIIYPSRKEVNCCPVCENTRGFAFGTCVNCGFNYISATFDFIKVHVDHLPKEVKDALIKYHAKKYKVETFVSYDTY